MNPPEHERRTGRPDESAIGQGGEHHRAILDSALDAIVSMDAAGVVTEFNAAAERMFGYTRVEAVGQRMVDLIVPAALREQHTAGLARYVAGGQSRILGRRLEISAVRRDGTEFPVELSIQRIGQSEPPAFTGFIRDTSQRKELEAQLRHSQKMEAIGQLAGGVAHDFNNILTVIQGHASLLMASTVRADEDVRASLEEIGEAAERAARLTRQLLAFGRKNVMQRTALNMNEIVANMTRMLHRILGEDIVLQVEPSAAPPFTHGDANMIEQILLNLAVNARDAMPSGGRLQIRTSIESIGAAFVREHPDAVEGRFVRLRVIDTGGGIPQEHLARIFEPFFTTKDVQQGTGLGLATVYGIVKQHGGWVTVHSEIGQGTAFDTYLPAIEPPSKPLDAATAADSVGGGRETVLLVEDEAPVRRLARLVLERNGYVVLEAPHGAAALDVWQQHRDDIHLVLTDMVMPEGISGLQLAERVLADRPQTPVIIASGYSVEVFSQGIQPDSRFAYLQKPYELQQLLRAVRAGLDAKPRA